MNILFISHYSNLYGANRSLIDLIDGLREYNVNPFVVIPNEGKITNLLQARNVPYEIVSVPSWVSGAPISNFRKRRTLIKLVKAVPYYRKIIKEYSIDIVYTNSSVTPIGRLVALLTGKPHIWHIREMLELHYNKDFVFPKWFSMQLISTSKAIICNSVAVQEHHFKQKKKKIHIIYNGIASVKEFEKYKNSNQKKISSQEKTFAIVGVIHPNKGQDKAIKAIADLKERGLNAELMIVGGGNVEYKNHCEDLVKKLNIKNRVKFTGYKSDPYEIFLNSFCLLVCSEFEAMGRVTVEGMSACLPIIAKNSGGTPEIILHGVTGFLYDTHDELVNYMEKFIKDPNLAKEMGLRGWEYAKERFTIEKYAKDIFKIISSI